jgi:small-conductance mechanosensitive channel
MISFKLVIHSKKPIFFLFLFFLSVLGRPAIGQVTESKIIDSIPYIITSDTISPVSDAAVDQKPGLISQIQALGQKEHQKSQKKFEARKTYLRQHELISLLKEENNQVKSLLNKGIDLEEIRQKIHDFKALIPSVSKGIADDGIELLTERNLTVTSTILSEMVDELTVYQSDLKNFVDSFRKAQYRIDSLSAQEDLYLFPSDSSEALQYGYLLIEISKETKPVEDSINSIGTRIDSLQTSLNELIFDLNSQIENLEKTRKLVNASIFEDEIPVSQNANFFSRTFDEALAFSWEKEKLVLIFYLKLYLNRIFLLTFFCLIVWYFLKTLKSGSEKPQEYTNVEESKIVLKSPLLSALVISIGLFQFIFPNPPFIFYWTLWCIASVSLSFIFWGYLIRFWTFFWMFTVVVFLFAGLQNMVLLPSPLERRIMGLLSLIGVVFLVFILFSKKTSHLKEKRIIYFIWLMGLFEAISLILNLTGRFNLSKSFLVSGYIGIVLGIFLLWTIRLVNQGLAIASRIYQNREKEFFLINFDRLGDRAPRLLYGLLVVGWLILVGKNFYAFAQISTGITEFLNQERLIGSYHFSINGLFVFVIILLISVLISRLLSVFSTDPEVSNSQDQRKRISFGSWLLLVQIFVISLGLFLAFAASGIPLDKITIILGALSVGIGLGLQGLVNNLVSGLILAFENTVKVGDLIEIEGKPGVMKSIGFRSSVVSMFEGATVIIPNGDLISKQLTNWTTGKGRKLTAIIGVAYGSDLDLAVSLLKEIIGKDSRIRMNPIPRVVPTEFTDSSIDIEVTFWVNSYLDYPFVKGELISKANALFNQNGVKIPFPQLDLHLKSGMKVDLSNPDQPESAS